MTAVVRTILTLVSLLAFSNSMFATTWYVRADGGTRWSTRVPTGQCDGKADAAYHGSGVNRHCAFGDYRFLFDDKSYGDRSGWVIQGGDTVILDNTKAWRVGFDQAGPNDPWCLGGTGPYSCSNPVIPAGTPNQHTRILGRNYTACSTPGGQPDPTRMTQLFGGHGVNTVLNLSGSQYVDVACIEVTRHSQCMIHGLPQYPNGCKTSFPLDDYDSEGVRTDNRTHDLLLQDMYIHGHTDRGVVGPIGGLVRAVRVEIAFNGSAGWDMDDGSGNKPVNGDLRLSYVSIIGSGCNQTYPATGAFPAISCYDAESAGYGDGFGTPMGVGISVSIDHSTFAYNTQDGVDLGHIDTGVNKLNITDSEAYGNMGGQFKWGANFQTAVFTNNRVVGNCLRMSAPLAGAPKTYNAHLSNFCRANDALSFNFRHDGKLLFANNRIATYAPVTFDINCWDDSCPGAVLTFQNNIVLGFANPGTIGRGGQPGGPAAFYFAHSIGKVIRSQNIFYGMRGMKCDPKDRCQDPAFIGEPQFRSEQDLDHFNFELSPASPKI